MRLVIVGGHLAPALSIIKSLNKEDDVFYLGRKHSFEGDKALSLEFQEINNLKIPFYEITTGRIQRKLTKFTVYSLLKFPVGFYSSYKILKKVNPDVVLSFGGYLSVPVIIAASVLNIPTVIHEQTLEAGAANKLLSKFASKILISWESSRIYFPKNKTILTGNPLKKEVKEIKNIQNENNLIYITGGSAGSHSINSLIENNLSSLLKKYSIIHQTGDSKQHNDFDRLTQIKNSLRKDLKDKYVLSKFYNSQEASENLQKSSLVIGRSGINTVSELIYFDKPALLIPLPFGQKNEQLKNALFLKELGLGEYLLQKQVTDEIFMSKVEHMMNNLKNYNLISNISFEDAENKIITVLRDVSKKKTT